MIFNISYFCSMRAGVYFLVVTFIFNSCSSKTDVDKLNFLKRGNMAYEDNDPGQAIRFYNEALAKDSTFVDAWNNRGLAEMKLGLFDEAIFSFNMAIARKPDYAEAFLNAAQANLAVHQHYAALDQLVALEKIWPDTSIIYFTRGLIYHDMKEDDEALESFEEARKRNKDNAEILVNMANINYHNMRSEEAIALIRESLVIDAAQPQAYNILAMTYADMGEFTEALIAINQAGSLDDQDAYIVNNKGYILFKMGRIDECESYFIQSMKLDPYNGWVYRNIGLLRFEQGDYAEAVRMFEKAVGFDSSIKDIYLELAKAWYKHGDSSKACDYLDQVENSAKKAELREVICSEEIS